MFTTALEPILAKMSDSDERLRTVLVYPVANGVLLPELWLGRESWKSKYRNKRHFDEPVNSFLINYLQNPFVGVKPSQISPSATTLVTAVL